MARAYEKDKKSGVWWKVLLTLAMLACVGMIGWYVYIHFFGKGVIISTSYEIEGVELEDGTKENFIEVKYFANKNGNGYETLDIKFNSLLDETRTKILSQGLQYSANTTDGKIEFQYVEDESNAFTSTDNGRWFGGNVQTWSFCGAFEANSETTTVWNYASTDSWQTAGSATKPLTNDSLFKITIDGEIYGVKFVGRFLTSDKDNCVEENLYMHEHSDIWWGGNLERYYYAYNDYNGFAKKIYDYAQGLAPGTNNQVVMPLGNMFEFYTYEDGRYSSTALTATQLVDLDINSFVVVKIEVSSSGAQKASDSLFNCLHGSQTFNLTGDYTNTDYFTGKTVVKCDIYDFDLVQVVDSYYCIKLCEGFIEYYLPYADTVLLTIEINLDTLSSKGIEFYGFAEDSQLELFTVYSCYTIKTVDGEVVKTEVAYE